MMNKVSLASGLAYYDLKVSGGPAIASGDRATIIYKLALSNEHFLASDYLESNHDPETPIEVLVDIEELLPGIYEGLLGMRGGGSIRRVYIPPALGYGPRSWGSIPASATLVAELLVSVVTKSDGQE